MEHNIIVYTLSAIVLELEDYSCTYYFVAMAVIIIIIALVIPLYLVFNGIDTIIKFLFNDCSRLLSHDILWL